jgi:predicted PurR-regulated permease PerM
MFLPFVAVLLAALVVVVVSWPLYAAVARRIGDIPAAVLTTLGLVVMVLVPGTIVVWLGAREALDAADQLVLFVTSGELEARLAGLEGQLRELGLLGDRHLFDLAGELARDTLGAAAQSVVGQVTGALTLVVGGSIQVIVGLAGTVTLYLEGPRLIAAVRRAGMVREAVLERLLQRFAQFAHNVVLGMLATTLAQSTVAALGFWLAGAPRVALLAVLTALFSQVPLVGSSVVWVPVALGMVAEGSWGRGLFVALWSGLLTASVDNLVKPILFRQGLDVNPLLVFLSLLAGLTTFGPAGVLVGPLMLVVFLTLWTLYERDLVDHATL